MKLIIAHDRGLDDYQLLAHCVTQTLATPGWLPVTEILASNSPLALRYATDHNLLFRHFSTDRKIYGRAAISIALARMLEMAGGVVIVSDGDEDNSTLIHLAESARYRGLPVGSYRYTVTG